ncbi:26S proteasome regulatory subunit 7 homolog B isoform X2 [Quercus suber]|uniref:26S proteasome regulatory subunit 7 homolog B isoform X2 n=1 Tax=Quercus suber TaxID=58331 RepID=UPI0032DF6BBA
MVYMYLVFVFGFFLFNVFTGLAAPSQWDLVSDQQLLREKPLEVARCTQIISPNTEDAKYVINFCYPGKCLIFYALQTDSGILYGGTEGVFDVDANTSIDQLSEDLNVKMPEVYYNSIDLNYYSEK